MREGASAPYTNKKENIMPKGQGKGMKRIQTGGKGGYKGGMKRKGKMKY